MIKLVPTEAALELLQDHALTHARSALRCPALSRQAAKEYGLEEAALLARELKAGTFTHVDGEPCLMEITEAFLKPTQLTFGGKEA